MSDCRTSSLKFLLLIPYSCSLDMLQFCSVINNSTPVEYLDLHFEILIEELVAGSCRLLKYRSVVA